MIHIRTQLQSLAKLYFLLLVAVILFDISAQAQEGGQRTGRTLPSIGKVYGKIIEEKSKDPVPFATVVLLNMKDSVISGGLTRNNGEFLLEKLPLGRYKLRITYIGFKTIIQPVTITPTSLEQDIGNIGLQPDDNRIKEAVITAQKPTVIIGVDRRIYNVEKDLSSAGGTAVDVMKNIPGLTVDADGNITLRNNSPTIFIDGRPTTLTMDQLPADQIERIEIITNPSAKYDASASGGIVNVILKKNDKPGYNGGLAANIGTNQFDGLNRYNLNGNLNIKEKRMNFSISYGLNNNVNPTHGYTNRTYIRDGKDTGEFNQNNVNTSFRMMQHIRIGFDYTLSNRNTLSISQRIMAGNFNSDDDQHFMEVDSNNATRYSGNRISDQENTMRNGNTQLMWKHTFPKQGKEFTMDLNYNYRNNSNSTLFTTNNYSSSGILMPGNPQIQNNIGGSSGNGWTFQSDYVNPLTDTARFEFGVKSTYNSTSTGLDVSKKYAPSQEFKTDTSLTMDYAIRELTNAIYVNYTNMFSSFGYQIGLRMEQTRFTADLLNKNQTFSYIYPQGGKNLTKALFPSIYLSRKIKTNHEVQANISRKINRPGWMQVIPFIMFSDRNNIQIGNPSLAPEFTNLGEINYNYIFKSGNWLTSAYFRYQESPITPYVYRSATDTNVLVSSFINGKSNIAYGWENTLKLSFLERKLDFSVNTNLFHTAITASTGTSELINNGFSWNVKSMLSYKFPKSFTGQINGSYEAPRIIAQGKTKEVYGIDFSLSKEYNKKWTFNFSINDVFNTRGFGSNYTTDYFTQDLWRRRETRSFRIGVNYKFGEWDVSLFRRKSRNNEPQQEPMEF